MHKREKAELVAGGTAAGRASKLDLSFSGDGPRVGDSFALRKGTAREALFVLKTKVWSADHDLSTNERVVLEVLLSYSDENRETFISVAKIGARTKLSEGTVRRCIARLRARGVVSSRIERTSTGRRNRYVLDVEHLSPRAHKNVGPRLAPNPPTDARQELDAASVQGRADDHLDRTGPVTVIRSPSPYPSSDRDHLIGLSPQPPHVQEKPVTAPSERRDEGSGEGDATRDAAWSVLAYFMTRLHPESNGPVITRDRRRLVMARLQEFRGDVQKLRDAVDGAALSRWHRESDIGFRADVVFRNADTIEQLARIGRSHRLQRTRTVVAPRSLPKPKAQAEQNYNPRGSVTPEAEAFRHELEAMFGMLAPFAKGA